MFKNFFEKINYKKLLKEQEKAAKKRESEKDEVIDDLIRNLQYRTNQVYEMNNELVQLRYEKAIMEKRNLELEELLNDKLEVC